MDEGIRVEHAPGGGVRVVLDDGRRVNVLSRARMAALAAVLDDLASRRPRPAFVALEGNGRGSFAAGADLAEIARLDPVRARELSLLGARVCHRLARGPWPTGALVDGHALGGGLDLVVSCDAAVATDRARFAHPGIRRSFLTGWGGTIRLPGRLPGGGWGRFREVFLAAGELDAAAADQAGLVSARTRSARSGRQRLLGQLQRLASWPAAALDAWRLGRGVRAPGRLAPVLEPFVDTPGGRC